mmetsp:Transcript_31874/g.48409  ORF Transcript_31874/g.48409 Transcript_31874/m.48409 type:complete len:414 (-) Transcript_31874:344-1585(-)
MIHHRCNQANFVNFLTLVDVIAIVGAIAVNILTSSDDGMRRDYSDAWFHFFALLTGFLWLKLLLFLKVVNPALATLVLAIKEILKDVKYLTLILAIVTFAFADMFHTIIRINVMICPVDEDPDGDSNPYCSRLSYLDMFTQILGQFDYGSFLGDPLSIVLFIFMTIFGAVIFLNILIAVVSNSYDKSRNKSTRLFGRARILTVAKIRTLERILKPKWFNREDTPPVILTKFLYKLLTLSCYALGIYRYSLSVNVFRQYGSSLSEVLAILMLILVLLGMTILCSFVITGWDESRRLLRLRIINDNFLATWLFWKPIVFIVCVTLGRHALFNEGDDRDSGDRAAGTKHIYSTVEHNLAETITSLKNRIEDYEKQSAEEIKALKEHLASQDRESIRQRILLENILETLNNTKSLRT